MNDETTSLLKAARDVLQKDLIRDVILRTSRAMDRADEVLFRECYHTDAWDDHGYYKGPIDEFRPGSIFRPPNVLSVMHFMGNILINLNGSVAFSEAYYVAYQRAEKNGVLKDTTFGGRYVDRMELRESAWKIARRVTIFDWTRVDQVVESFDIPGAVTGLASKKDYSYNNKPTA